MARVSAPLPPTRFFVPPPETETTLLDVRDALRRYVNGQGAQNSADQDARAKYLLAQLLPSLMAHKGYSTKQYEDFLHAWEAFDRRLLRERLNSQCTTAELLQFAQALKVPYRAPSELKDSVLQASYCDRAFRRTYQDHNDLGVPHAVAIPFEHATCLMGPQRVMSQGYLLVQVKELPEVLANCVPWCPSDGPFPSLAHTPEWHEETNTWAPGTVAYESDETKEPVQQRRKVVAIDPRLRLFRPLLEALLQKVAPRNTVESLDTYNIHATSFPQGETMPPCMKKIHQAKQYLLYAERDIYGMYCAAARIPLGHLKEHWGPTFSIRYKKGDIVAIFKLWEMQQRRRAAGSATIAFGPTCKQVMELRLCPFTKANDEIRKFKPHHRAKVKLPSVEECIDASARCCNTYMSGNVHRRILHVADNRATQFF